MLNGRGYEYCNNKIEGGDSAKIDDVTEKDLEDDLFGNSDSEKDLEDDLFGSSNSEKSND